MEEAMRPEGEAEMQGHGKAVRCAVSAACLGMMVLLGGCSNFFVCQKASCTDTGGGTTTGNLAYVSNSTSGTTSIAGYDISKGALTAATSSPYSLGITPAAMVVTQNNKFLYVASTNVNSSGQTQLAGIYGFSIASTGALNVLNSGTALQTQESVAAMDVSADGQWLIVTTGLSLSNTTITAYQINSTSGLLTASTPLAYQVTAGAPNALKIAPSGQYIAISLATGGILVFPFNTSTGQIGTSTVTSSSITFGSSAVGAYDLAIDSNNFLYIAATGNIYSYSVSSGGIPAAAPVATTPTGSGGPYSVALDGTSYVYASALDGTSSLIYQFSNVKGVLTKLSTATVAAPSQTTKLAVDSTKAYLMAAGYDTNAGLRIYSIGTSGLLNSLAASGTGVPGSGTALALTH